jgi:hypothetical protein
MMRKMRQLQINPDWALGRDKAQWILRGRSGTRWHDIAFILSTKHVLARCRHENGVPAHDDQNILNSRIRLLRHVTKTTAADANPASTPETAQAEVNRY